MDQQQDTTSEIDQEEQSFTAPITEPVIAELPERLQIFAPDGFFTARWKHCHDDMDHDKATAVEANNRVV
ncbi:hypothetical protein E4U58_006853 [Claviceps cyperi]|nr:hypothetical protein E4U58_006853 [Claviceps cyperi]